MVCITYYVHMYIWLMIKMVTRYSIIICVLISNKGPLLSKSLQPDLWKGTTVKTPQNSYVYIQLPWIVVHIQQQYVYRTVIEMF